MCECGKLFPFICYSFFYLICFIWYCSKSQKEKQTNGIMLLKCRRTSKHKMKIAAYIHYLPIHRIFGIISAYILHAGIINSDAAAATTATATAAMKSNEPPHTHCVKHTNFLMVYSVCALWILYSPGFFLCSRHRFVFVFFLFFVFTQPCYSNKLLCAYFWRYQVRFRLKRFFISVVLNVNRYVFPSTSPPHPYSSSFSSSLR